MARSAQLHWGWDQAELPVYAYASSSLHGALQAGAFPFSSRDSSGAACPKDEVHIEYDRKRVYFVFMDLCHLSAYFVMADLRHSSAASLVPPR